LGSPGLSSQSVSGFSGRQMPKTPKRTGMTTLGSPGLSSQSVLGFSGRKGSINPEMDWDDNPRKPRLVIPILFRVFWPKRSTRKQKRTGMTTQGSPGLSSQSVSGFSGRKRPKKPETDWDDNPGRPSLSSQSVSGFSGRKGPNNPETEWDDNPGKLVIPVRFPEMDWDDNLGKDRLVIPIRFGVFWQKRTQKTRNGLG